MARIRKRGKTWSYEIKKTKTNKAYYGSGYRTKKEAERVAKEIEVQISSGVEYKVQPEMTLVELFDNWLNVEILPQNIELKPRRSISNEKDGWKIILVI